MPAMHGRLSDPISYQALQQFITDSPWETRGVWAQLRTVVPVRRGILAVDDTSFPQAGTPVGRRATAVLRGARDTRQLPGGGVHGAARRPAPLAPQLRAVPAAGLAHRSRAAGQGADSRGRALSQEMADRPGAYPPGPQGGLSPHGRGGGRRLRVDGGVSSRPRAPRAALRPGHPVGADDVDARRAPHPDGRGDCHRSARRGDRWLLCAGSLLDDERKYYLLNLETTASLRALVTVARSRWPIEQQARELKDELGIDHFEGRSYWGWEHHTVFTAMAFTFLQLERMRSDDDPRPTLPYVRFWVREIMAVLYIIGNRKLLNLIVSFQRNPPLRK